MNQFLYWGSVIAICVAVFYLLRSVILWYFRIDERTELLRQQNRLLQAILEQLSGKGKVNG